VNHLSRKAAVTDPVWREDVQKEAEYLDVQAKVLANLYYGAKELGAPAPLLDELSLVWQDLGRAKERLAAAALWFPSMPKDQRST
jgi:hypothetical protein